MFDEKAQKALGYYVYMLIDPRDIDNPTNSDEKCDVIREIGSDKVRRVIVTHGLATETEAYKIEAVLIDVLNYMSKKQLTNKVVGHHAGKTGWRHLARF